MIKYKIIKTINLLLFFGYFITLILTSFYCYTEQKSPLILISYTWIYVIIYGLIVLFLDYKYLRN